VIETKKFYWRGIVATLVLFAGFWSDNNITDDTYQGESITKLDPNILELTRVIASRAIGRSTCVWNVRSDRHYCASVVGAGMV
jgi:hypothetical protein